MCYNGCVLEEIDLLCFSKRRLQITKEFVNIWPPKKDWPIIDVAKSI